MKAALLRAIGQPLSIEDVPVPEIGPGDALVETRACGICRTDLHIQEGLAYVPTLPHVPGHEPAGVVVAIGQGVTNVAVGDRVVPHLFVTCGECRACVSGLETLCQRTPGILGVTFAGAFAEFFRVPAVNLLRIQDHVPFEWAGLTSCAIVTAVNAFEKRESELESGPGPLAPEIPRTYVVLGAGGIGQLLIQLLRRRGARVVAIDSSSVALALASELGAHLAISPTDPEVVFRVRDFSRGGADGVFECVGTSSSMGLAAEVSRDGGRIVVIGEEPELPAIDTIRIAQRQLQIVGTRNGSRAQAAQGLALLADETLRPVIGGRFPLSQVNEALALLRSGTARGRIVIEFPRQGA